MIQQAVVIICILKMIHYTTSSYNLLPMSKACAQLGNNHFNAISIKVKQNLYQFWFMLMKNCEKKVELGPGSVINKW